MQQTTSERLGCELRPKLTGSKESQDSGLGVDDPSPPTPDDATSPLVHAVTAERRLTPAAGELYLSAVFPAGLMLSDDYVGLDEVMTAASNSTTTTSAVVLSPVMSPSGYVIAWTDGYGRDRTVDGAHLLPDVDSSVTAANSTLQQDADDQHFDSCHHDHHHQQQQQQRCHDDGAASESTNQYVTTDQVFGVFGRGEVDPKYPAVNLTPASDPLHAIQSYSRDKQSNGVSSYITLEQLQGYC